MPVDGREEAGQAFKNLCPIRRLIANVSERYHSAPASFKTAFQSAINLYQGIFNEPITINISVGWGKVGGYAVSCGALGEIETAFAGSCIDSQMRNVLVANAKSSADLAAVASLPTSDPTGGRRELMGTAEAKALGLGNGSSFSLDALSAST